MSKTHRVAFITGCSEPTSLGAALARDLLSRKWRVFVSARKISTLEPLKALGCEAVQLDVVDQESVDEAVNIVSGLTGGRLDLLVNNAGVVAQGPMLDMDVDRVKAVYDVNVFGIFRVTQAFSPLLVHTANTDAYGASRGKGETTVVNVGSLSTVLPAWMAAYASSKAAVLLLSDSMRLELAPLGVKVTCIKLAYMRTPMTQAEKTFPVLKDKPTGFYPWTESLEAAHEKQLANTLDKMPTPTTVAKTIIDSVEKRGPQPYVWAGYPSGLIKWFFRFLPTGVLDKAARDQEQLHLIPRPVHA